MNYLAWKKKKMSCKTKKQSPKLKNKRSIY